MAELLLLLCCEYMIVTMYCETFREQMCLKVLKVGSASTDCLERATAVKLKPVATR